eukprot:gene35445-45930_t
MAANNDWTKLRYPCESNTSRCVNIYFVVTAISLVVWIIGVVLMSVNPPTNSCGSGCIETNCIGDNEQSYPCTCGDYCEDEQSSIGPAFKAGCALLGMGFFIMAVACARGFIILSTLGDNNTMKENLVANPRV